MATEAIKNFFGIADKEDIYRSDVLDKLDVKNGKFKRRLMAIAYKEPSTYFKLQSDFTEKMVEKAVEAMYTTFYDALTKGVDGVNWDEKDDGNQVKMRPNMSRDKANKIALDFCATYHDAIEKFVIDKVFDPSIYSGALNRSAKRPDLA